MLHLPGFFKQFYPLYYHTYILLNITIRDFFDDKITQRVETSFELFQLGMLVCHEHYIRLWGRSPLVAGHIWHIQLAQCTLQ